MRCVTRDLEGFEEEKVTHVSLIARHFLFFFYLGIGGLGCICC